MTLAVVSSLGILAGSSMSGWHTPSDLPPAPLGSSATDPFFDQLVYHAGKLKDGIIYALPDEVVDIGQEIVDTGSALGEMAINGASNLTEGIIGVGENIVDGVQDAADEVIGKIIDIFT